MLLTLTDSFDKYNLMWGNMSHVRSLFWNKANINLRISSHLSSLSASVCRAESGQWRPGPITLKVASCGILALCQKLAIWKTSDIHWRVQCCKEGGREGANRFEAEHVHIQPSILGHEWPLKRTWSTRFQPVILITGLLGLMNKSHSLRSLKKYKGLPYIFFTFHLKILSSTHLEFCLVY